MRKTGNHLACGMTDTGAIDMRSMLEMFPTEPLILHKMDGTSLSLVGLVDSNMIHSDDANVMIEENDIFERTLPNGGKEYYRVTDRGFYRGDHGIPDHYQSKVEKVSQAELDRLLRDSTFDEKPHKIFISHSSKDADYVEAIVGLLETLGLREDEIICSSVPPYCIPLDNKVYDWLVKEFQQSDLHVIYALSDDYYGSAASLNEMGAAWAMKHRWTGLLMPGFSFSRITGCIDSTQISIKLDDSDRKTLNFRLGELKENLTSEFGLRSMSPAIWDRKREEFLEKIASIRSNREMHTDIAADTIPEYVPVVGQDDVGNIPLDVAFLLVYAAAGDGQIIRAVSMSSPTEITTSGRQFMAEKTKRESARWQEALDTLVKWGWVKAVGKGGDVFEVTGTGYNKADWLKENMKINTENEPLNEIQQYY